MVRGCKNIETYAISKTREMGNSVFMCKECMADALKSAENYIEPVKSDKKAYIKPLFYHHELDANTSTIGNEPELAEVIGLNEAKDIPVVEVNANTDEVKADIGEAYKFKAEYGDKEIDDDTKMSVVITEAEKHICDKCGKECASKLGLINHSRYCKGV